MGTGLHEEALGDLWSGATGASEFRVTGTAQLAQAKQEPYWRQKSSPGSGPSRSGPQGCCVVPSIGPALLLVELCLRTADGPGERVNPCPPAKAQGQLNVDVTAAPELPA